MKITNIVNYISRTHHTLFVKVETDEGVCGYGECSPMDYDSVCHIIQQRIKPKLIGKSPFDTEMIEQLSVTQNYKFSGQLLAIAFSGVEIALWDLKGKYLRQPVYNLLGGKYRDKIEFYISSMTRYMGFEQECEKISKALKSFGTRAAKIKVGARFGNSTDIVDLAADTLKVKAVRAVIGSNCKLMVDGNGSYTYFQAIQLFDRIKEYDIYHYEEPCPYYDVEAYVKLAQALPVPINWGEQDWNLFTFRDFISRGACHICAADVTKCGGFGSAKRVAALCRAFGVQYGPHNTSRGLGFAANLHLAASTPECNYYQEYNIEPGTAQAEFLKEEFKVQDGCIIVPEAPGLGVEMDEEKMEKIMEIIGK